MKSPAIPTVSYDLGVGRIVQGIELCALDIAELMRGQGGSEESIDDTAFHVVADEGPELDDAPIMATAEKRFVTVYAGSFVRRYETGGSEDDVTKQSVLATVAGSITIAHEIKHLAQLEEDAIPVMPNPVFQETAWRDLPWEREALKAEEEYIEQLRTRSAKLLFLVKFKFSN